MIHHLTIADAFPASVLDFIGTGDLSLGIDIGTTEGKKSNPSAFALTEDLGLTKALRLGARFKTGQKDVLVGVLDRILTLCENRGSKLKVAVLDATNERLTAVEVVQDFAGRLSVRLALLGTTRLVFGEKVTLKTYICGLVTSHLEDGRLLLPAAEWITKDFRQMVREKGGFTSAVAEDGAHADLFIATGLSLDGHDMSGPAEAAAVPTSSWGPSKPSDDDDEESKTPL
jgi:hypothetical protein